MKYIGEQVMAEKSLFGLESNYEKPTKFEKNLPLVLTNSCFYSVASKEVGDFFKFMWPSQKS